MKKEIVSILVCMLLIATSLVIIPDKNTVQAEETEESGSDLDLEYLWSNIRNVADVIYRSYETGDIRKGRYMGSKGGNDTCNDIIKWEMDNMGLSNIRKEQIKEIDGNDIYYNRLLDVVGYNLTVNNYEYPFSNDIPKSEVYPVVRTEIKEGSGLNYINYFNDSHIIYDNFRIWLPDSLFDSVYEITDYETYNDEYDEFVGILQFITEEEQPPDPVDQQGTVYSFDWDDDAQSILDNLTYAAGVVLIDIDKRAELNLSNNHYQVQVINDTAGDNIQNILDNYTNASIDNYFGNITVHYEFNNSCLPESEYVVIDRIPDHIELKYDQSRALNRAWEDDESNPPFPNLIHYLTCAGIASYILHYIINRIRPFNQCVGIVLYSSFDHHIMLPRHLRWAEREDIIELYYGNDNNGYLPMICINETLGEFLNDTRDETTIDGDIHQKYYEGTEENPGVEAENVMGEINIAESPDDQYVIISNRYDGMWGETPSDSGIGTAIVLALARHQKNLQQNYSVDPKYNITYLFTTGEEMGFRGAYYQRDKWYQTQGLDDIRMWIGFDQLGMDQGDLVSAPGIRSKNSSNASLYKDVIWAIANITNYEDRSGYSFLSEIKTEPEGSEDYVWAEGGCDTVVYKKDTTRSWDRWHATGDFYENGDSLKYTDVKDVNLTFDMAWLFVKYICYNPDCWFDSVTFTQVDSPDDADYLYDSIWVNYTINTKMPHDQNMIHVNLTNSSGYIDTWQNITVNTSGKTGSILMTVPPEGGYDIYRCRINLYNSTGRINHIVGIGTDANNVNDSRPQPPFDPVYELYPFEPDVTPPTITNIDANPDPVGFGQTVTISADISDPEPGSGLYQASASVFIPGGFNPVYTMDHVSGDTYQCEFNLTWVVGQYGYSIIANDNKGNNNQSTGHSFNVSANATIGIFTLKDEYTAGEYINITDPPTPPEDYYITDRGMTWNEYYNAVSGHNILEAYSGPVNYQDENDEWIPINCTINQLEDNHPAYNYGYRAGNEEGIYHAYFKPNIQNSWPVALAYNKSDDPTTHVLRSKLIGVGYLDPSSNWDYKYLQSVQNSQGEIDDNVVTYEDAFTGADVVWRYGNAGLKEEIILTDETKTVLQDNPPSDFGLSNQNSYLVFITKLDYQNLEVYEDGIVKNGNFTVGDLVRRLDFKDLDDKVRFTMPIGYAYEQNNVFNETKLLYRVLQYNGEHYLLSGLKVTDANDFEFPLVIDPSIDFYSNVSDGYIYKMDPNYNDAKDAAEGTVQDSITFMTIGRTYDDTFPPAFYAVYRGFLMFNTSCIPDDSMITNATISLYGLTDYTEVRDFLITVQNGQPLSPHIPMLPEDYNKVNYSGNGGEFDTEDFVVEAYNNLTLDEDGISWINKSDITKLCLRSNYDYRIKPASPTPTGKEFVMVRTNEQNGCEPKLVIEYQCNQSKIKNTGSTNISGYLLIQVQYNDSGDWVVDNDTINETTTRTVNIGGQLALDLIFNGLVSTDDLVNGDGTYRVYAAFRDPNGNVLVTDDETYLAAWYEFEVDTS